jgi:hypothetical protein
MVGLDNVRDKKIRPATQRRCPAFPVTVEGLRASGQSDDFPHGLLARAAFRRAVGDWSGAARDLDEVEEIAEPGPMRLFLCDTALERARLALARREAFAPLNGLIEKSPPKPSPPDAAEAAALAEETRQNLASARKLITDCGYHRRDEELAELEKPSLRASAASPTCRLGCDGAPRRSRPLWPSHMLAAAVERRLAAFLPRLVDFFVEQASPHPAAFGRHPLPRAEEGPFGAEKSSGPKPRAPPSRSCSPRPTWTAGS